MNIGFDAKRAYQNSTGLGQYSRILISMLNRYYPENQYFLFAPKITNRFNTAAFKNIHPVSPQHFPSRFFTSMWRSNWVTKDLLKNRIDVYHGLSHEIPVGISKTGIRSVVTIHDLIFEKYPEQYHPIDRMIYRKKFRYACTHANKIIAISHQTKQDIIDLYKIPGEKITVCKQNCSPAFNEIITEEKKAAARLLYNLPPQFFLYVGSIIERKNLLLICKALKQIGSPIPLVVIGGGGGAYKEKVKKYIAGNNLQQHVIFLSENPAATASAAFRSSADFPAIYQMATALVYPSLYEGFGLPIQEALCSRLPVITSNISCMPETAGEGALFVNPYEVDEIALAMEQMVQDTGLRKSLVEKGLAHLQHFTEDKCARGIMDVYKSL